MVERQDPAGASTEEDPRIVLVTAPAADVARELARGMVSARLAACANLLDGVTSVYRWKGAVEEEREVLMIVKTSAARLPELEAFVRAQHPYDVPELVAIEPASVEPRYLAWLLECCRPQEEGAEERP